MRQKCFRKEYLFKDTPYIPTNELADYTGLDVVVEGSHIYGEIMWPDGSYKKDRPCVILFHGFPGTGRNDDILFSLRRAGCVTINVHHRGAWGSQGKYLVSNCVKDAIEVAKYAKSKSFVNKYKIDPSKIFLIGHSMGGNTVVNAAKKLPWIKGIILLTPFNTAMMEGNDKFMEDLMNEGTIMNQDGPKAMLKDLRKHAHEYNYLTNYKKLMGMNICSVCGSLDPLIQYDVTVKPLVDTLIKEKTKGLIKTKIVKAGHGLDQYRISTIRFIAEFIDEVL